MKLINEAMVAVLVLLVVFVLLKPNNKTSDVIKALGNGSSQLTRTLTGQYAGSGYSGK